MWSYLQLLGIVRGAISVGSMQGLISSYIELQFQLICVSLNFECVYLRVWRLSMGFVRMCVHAHIFHLHSVFMCTCYTLCASGTPAIVLSGDLFLLGSVGWGRVCMLIIGSSGKFCKW